MTWKYAKCLVTGGASFIGSHLVESLLEKGVQVRVADDLSSGKLANLSSVLSEIEFMKGDLKHIDVAHAATRGVDAVFHLAANHGGRGYIATHPADCAGNMALDNIVFGCAAKNDVEHIIFASSACVYPTDIQAEKRLLVEDMVDFSRRGGAFADEAYGWAKLMGELSLQAYHRQYGLKAAAARISTAYGPRENESHALMALIAKVFVRQSPFEIWGDGEQTRGFTYVQDVVDGLVLAAEHIEDGTAVNVGTDEFIRLNRVAGEIFTAMNWRPPAEILYRADKPLGVRHRALDGTFARRTTGWVPQVSLTEGIRRTVAWYMAHHDAADVAARLDNLLMERRYFPESG
ncbi:MAG: NAD-dependent epimerase/dehydratase family protein [Acidobacteria bacterium]|nr:NAD-dependent epimerase/dehydratase family protein [Acidobacteriota bacterium]